MGPASAAFLARMRQAAARTVDGDRDAATVLVREGSWTGLPELAAFVAAGGTLTAVTFDALADAWEAWHDRETVDEVTDRLTRT